MKNINLELEDWAYDLLVNSEQVKALGGENLELNLEKLIISKIQYVIGQALFADKMKDFLATPISPVMKG
jgi:hypothetical protein